LYDATPTWQENWTTYSFVDLSVAALSLYISPDELSREELRALVSRSYTTTFRHPDITPLAKLSETEYIFELFHGPTFSFKDVALQLLGNLFEFFLARRNARKSDEERPESLTVVGATSGDTGGCACGIFALELYVYMFLTIRRDEQRGYLWLEGEKECVHIHLASQGSHFTSPRSTNDDRR